MISISGWIVSQNLFCPFDLYQVTPDVQKQKINALVNIKLAQFVNAHGCFVQNA